jgi:hypothetical protein
MCSQRTFEFLLSGSWLHSFSIEIQSDNDKNNPRYGANGKKKVEKMGATYRDNTCSQRESSE